MRFLPTFDQLIQEITRALPRETKWRLGEGWRGRMYISKKGQMPAHASFFKIPAPFFPSFLRNLSSIALAKS